MRIVNRDSAEHYVWGGTCDGWRLLARDQLSVIEERIPPGSGEVAHLHHHASQLFYVLAGRLRIDTPDASFELAPGDTLEVTPETVHRVHNPFADDARFLVVSAPTTRGDRTNV